MSVWKPKRGVTFRYFFHHAGVPYRGTTGQRTKELAEQFERNLKDTLRKQAGGLIEWTPSDTPTFTAWAGTTLVYQTKFIKRPAILERTLRMVLGFWGAPPAKPIGPAAVVRPERAPRPYHNLRLGDPIADPTWLAKFEDWMADRGISGSTRNSYLSACSDLFACALQPQFRPMTHIATNPFDGIRRSPPNPRTIALTTAQILALVTEAGQHIAACLCIAALAPKLRVATILDLQWAMHFDPAFTRIRVEDHKTSGTSGAQIVPVSDQLRGILADIRAQQDPALTHVITWRGEPITTIKTGLRRAVTAIGLPWGLRAGVTFHVMRHSVATILADPTLVGQLTERLRADVMGHGELRTTQKYTHLNPTVQAAPHEALSAALAGLRAAATRPPRQAKGSRVESMKLAADQTEKHQQKAPLAFPPLAAQKRA